MLFRKVWNQVLRQLCQRFPYSGLRDWGLVWSVSFIAAQLLWFCARYFRWLDVLEIPMAIFFFPLAPICEPHDMMVNHRGIFPYALGYWLVLFVGAIFLSRKRVNPAVPALAVLLLSAAISIAYSEFFVYHGPME